MNEKLQCVRCARQLEAFATAAAAEASSVRGLKPVALALCDSGVLKFALCWYFGSTAKLMVPRIKNSLKPGAPDSGCLQVAYFVSSMTPRKGQG